MEWLKFAHIITIIAAIGLAEASILPIVLAARRGDVVALRGAMAAGQLGEKVANPLALISIAFGIGAAIVGQIELTTSWLVGAYVLLATAIGLGLVGGFRHEERIVAAAGASPSDRPSAELQRLLDARWTGVVAFGPPLLMGGVVFLMVMKPNLW
jgi:hypothetical protein